MQKATAPSKGPLTETSFASAFAAGDARATAFLDDGFRSDAERIAHARRAAARTMNAEVLRAIAAQNARLDASEARDRHLALLARGQTAVVVTGQQLGLFLGPLFTLCKAASAIRDARALSVESGVDVVPVFWLQNEDHDFEEIATCALPTGGAPLALTLAGDARHPRTPVGARTVDDSIHAVRAQLVLAIGHEPFAEETLALLDRCFVAGETLTTCFARLVGALFARDGLVVVDPRDPIVAAHAACVHRRAVASAAEIARVLSARSDALTAAGFAPQVHVRPDAPLSFFAPDDDDGPRYRLARGDDGAYALVGADDDARRFSERDLLAALDAHPLRFSSSALLRPIVQDTLLPTAAYVGGPGECAYFAQLAPLYAHFGVDMPLFAPRARALVVDDKARALLAKLEVPVADALGPREQLLARAVSPPTADAAPDAVRARLGRALAPELDAFAQTLATLDPSLEKATARALETIDDALDRLVAKYARVLAQRDSVGVERALRLRALLLPDDAPQERVYGVVSYLARHGVAAFVALVTDGVVPFSDARMELRP